MIFNMHLLCGVFFMCTHTGWGWGGGGGGSVYSFIQRTFEESAQDLTLE